jgi:hypothetical protein
MHLVQAVAVAGHAHLDAPAGQILDDLRKLGMQQALARAHVEGRYIQRLADRADFVQAQLVNAVLRTIAVGAA